MTHFISYKGKEICFRSKGRGKTIVLLHGFLESMDIWDSFSEILSAEFRVLCIDLPGHGNSDYIAEVHSIELMSEVVKGVLDHCGIKDCLMAGHSMGGYVALDFARSYGNYLSGICLFNSNALADTPDAKVNRSRAIAVVKQNHQGFIAQFLPALFAPGNEKVFHNRIIELQKQAMQMSIESIVAALEGMKARESQMGFLSETELPILFIIGKKDPRADLQSMLMHISLPKHSEALIIENCGHMGWLEAEKESLKMLASFAARCFN